jgi:hypothetical protein
MAIIGAKITNIRSIENALIKAFEQWAEEDINDSHWKDQFQDEKWRHSPLTVRANGEQVGSPRDIYDLGALYESGVKSYRFERTVNGVEANWHWDAKNRSGKEYAWYVHEGLGTNEPYERRFTDDISIPSSFFRKGPGRALKIRVQQELDSIGL